MTKDSTRDDNGNPIWKKTPLTSYLDDAISNIQKTMSLKLPLIRYVDDADAIFSRIIEECKFSQIGNQALTPYFFAASYSAYRGAILLWAGGNFSQIPPLLRQSVECAAYCHLVLENTDLAKIWLNRNSSAEALKLSKEKFKFSDAVNHIGESSSDLKKWMNDIYKETIEYGAHPNVKGILPMGELTPNSESIEFSFLAPDTDSWRVAGQQCLKCAVIVLSVFENLVPDEYPIGVRMQLEVLKDKIRLQKN